MIREVRRIRTRLRGQRAACSGRRAAAGRTERPVAAPVAFGVERVHVKPRLALTGAEGGGGGDLSRHAGRW